LLLAGGLGFVWRFYDCDSEREFSLTLSKIHNSVVWFLTNYRALACTLRRLRIRFYYLPLYGKLYLRKGLIDLRYFLKVRFFYIRYFLSRHGIGHF